MMDPLWEYHRLPGTVLEYERKKPLKIWDGSRRVRKGIAVESFEELVIRGREKLGIPPHEPVSFVLDYDGTQIDDSEYFQYLPINTVLLVLRQGEYWRAARMEVLRAAVTAIPRIVCETIQSLHLEDEIPTWKIMDNKGRVTVVLHWNQPREAHPHHVHMHTRPHTCPHTSTPRASPSRKHPIFVPSNSDGTKTIITPSGKKETLINDIYPPPPKYSNSPQITVINHDEVQRVAAAYQAAQRMTKSGTCLDGTIHIHTMECAPKAEEPMDRAESPDYDSVECDFHCCSLNEGIRSISILKSVATSPIQDQKQVRSSPQPSALSDGKRSGVKQQVRFLDLEEGTTVLPGESDDSTDDDSDNGDNDEDTVKTKKFLLLVDQLTSQRRDHLSVKDIGQILERLSSTILDVERLNRETEYEGCHNWTIKATIRGDDLNDLGLIYNGYYFVVSEHPEYKGETRIDKPKGQTLQDKAGAKL